VLALRARVARARPLPAVLSGHLVDRQKVRRAGVEALQVERVAVEDGRGGHAELNPVFAVPLLELRFPDFLALEVVAGQVPGPDEGPDVPAVGGGRRARVIALVP